METVQNKCLSRPSVFMKTISVKYLELTNHDPIPKLKIISKAETFYSFSQKRNNELSNQFLFPRTVLDFKYRKFQYTLDIMRLGEIRVRLKSVLDQEIARIYPAKIR